MKNIILLFLVITLFSCSDNLTENKIESLVENCLEDNPVTKDTTITVGTITLYKNSKNSPLKLEKYHKLKDAGYVSIEKKSENTRGTKYLITPTEKLKEITLAKNKNSILSLIRRSTIKVKLYEYELNEVLEIHEIPSANLANVKLSFAPINYTEVAKVLSSRGRVLNRKKAFKKTNSGWTTNCNTKKTSFPLF
jgi:hypothetical protein